MKCRAESSWCLVSNDAINALCFGSRLLGLTVIRHVGEVIIVKLDVLIVHLVGAVRRIISDGDLLA
jgi:hypothetical protein